ncbi:MAG: uroporphyrinogen decarboxylase [Legionellales bacterium]|nr:uroporphyrinogen decarboxylase [Legionellales bacterium]OUX64206.1 MAG: uroporphyrinogen decarboxylase [Gammaproteobacteria bacterium TMED281]
MIGKERLLNTLNGKPVDKPPIWLMRQAGRYLPEYRTIRAKMDKFQDLYNDPKIATEIALQPLNRFDLDAAIVFADILTLVESVGIDVTFQSGIGPVITDPIREERDLKRLSPANFKLHCVYDTLQSIGAAKPQHGLVGFCGSPWTLATYMVEGKKTKDLHIIKKIMNSDPKLISNLLTFLTNELIEFIKKQALAGADMVVLFDTWGGMLSPNDYYHWSLPYIQQIIDAVHPIPLFVFTKNCLPFIDRIIQSQPFGVCVDWSCPLEQMYHKTLAENICLQGNFDPSILFASDKKITETVHQQLNKLHHSKRYIPSLGHGLTPTIQPEKVAHFIEALRQFNWSKITPKEDLLT